MAKEMIITGDARQRGAVGRAGARQPRGEQPLHLRLGEREQVQAAAAAAQAKPRSQAQEQPRPPRMIINRKRAAFYDHHMANNNHQKRTCLRPPLAKFLAPQDR